MKTAIAQIMINLTTLLATRGVLFLYVARYTGLEEAPLVADGRPCAPTHFPALLANEDPVDLCRTTAALEALERAGRLEVWRNHRGVSFVCEPGLGGGERITLAQALEAGR